MLRFRKELKAIFTGTEVSLNIEPKLLRPGQTSEQLHSVPFNSFDGIAACVRHLVSSFDNFTKAHRRAHSLAGTNLSFTGTEVSLNIEPKLLRPGQTSEQLHSVPFNSFRSWALKGN
jgi:hypothetical protein